MTEETVNEIQWTIHQTHPEMVKQAREKLSEVVDPEIGMNIIQLGLVRDIAIENDIARLEYISAVRVVESGICVLLYKKKSCACLVDLVYGLKNSPYN